MNKQENQEPNNQQPQIEDLTVNEDLAAEVKGGPEKGYSAVVFVGGWGSSSYQY